MTALPDPVATAAHRFRELAGDEIAALYVIGSVPLGDWQPGASDVDLVAVAASPRPPARATLLALHAAQRAACPEPPLEVLHLRAGDLAVAPDTIDVRPHHNVGLLREDAEMLTPVIWHSVADHGVPIASVDEAAVGEIHRDDRALRDWCRSNLDGYWAGWATRGANAATRDGMTLLTDWGVAWCVLGVLRLRYTIATGEITSKTGAGRWALETGDPTDRPLIEAALALRGVAEPRAPGEIDRARARERRDAVVAFLRRAIAAR